MCFVVRLSRAQRALGSCVIVLAACVLPSGVEALRPCPPNRPVLAVWPNVGTGEVPADSVAFVRLQMARKDLVDLVLLDTATGKRVEAKVTTLEEPNLLMLRPAAPMAAGHPHDLWAHIHVKGKSHFGRPSTTQTGVWEVTVTTIHPTAKKAGTAAPRLKTGHIAFGPWRDADGDMAHLRDAGREADLTFDKGSTGVAAVLIRGQFDGVGEYEPKRWVADFAFGPQLNISNVHGMPCHGDGPPRPPAPKAGKYELVVTPWSMTGVVGEPVKLKGSIQTSRR